MISAPRQSGVIGVVPFGLLDLIFLQVIGLISLPGRTASSKDITLLVLRHEVAMLRRTNPGHAWAGRTGRSWQPSSDSCRRGDVGIVWSPGHDPALAPPPGDQ